MPRAQQTDPTRGKPLTLAALRELSALDDIAPPTGDFDPNGPWKHTYQIWLVGRKASGFLRLERTPAPDGKSATLNVEMSVAQMARTALQTNAQLDCAADPLASPRSWKIESVLLDAEGRPIELSRVNESATVKNGTIEVKAGDKTLTRTVPSPFTTNWSLFDAVQRLSGKDAKPLEFALLEDLDLVKENQRLSYWQDAQIELGGKTIALHGYQQIGAGILPYQYWVDDQHRLLFAISGVRAYILDPKAPERMGQNPKAPAKAGKGKKKKKK